MKCPCSGCRNRQQACHGSCEQYAAWKWNKEQEKKHLDGNREIRFYSREKKDKKLHRWHRHQIDWKQR